MKTNYLAISMVLFIGIACKTTMIAYDADQEIPDEVQYSEMISYYLPKSILKVRVPITVNTLKEGLIHKLPETEQSEILQLIQVNYGWTPVSVKDKFSLGDRIIMEPITLPDPDRHYIIAYKNLKFYSQVLKLSFSKDGIISSGEFAQKDKTIDIVSKGVEMGANLASNLYPLLGTAKSKFEDFQKEMGYDKPSVSIEAKRIIVLLDELNKLSQGKLDMLSNVEPNVSKDALEYRVVSIENRMEEIKKAILGSVKKTTHWIAFEYVPTLPNAELMQIDPENGINVPLVDNQGIDTQLTKDFDSNKSKSLKIISNQIISHAVEEAITQPKKEKGFLRYTIPPKYSIELEYDGKKLKSFKDLKDKDGSNSFSMYFPQLGPVGVLPADFNGAEFVFYEDIGAIKSIKYSNDPIEEAEIEGTAAAIDSLIAYKAKKKAIDDAADDTDSTDDEEVEETVIRIIFGRKRR